MGRIYNSSSHMVWIVSDNQRFPLLPGKLSTVLGITDADGLLLDGRPMFYDSILGGLGGGKFHTGGAIKICGAGFMSIFDSIHLKGGLRVTLDADSYLCPAPENGGYKDAAWCASHPGWDFKTSPIGFLLGRAKEATR